MKVLFWIIIVITYTFACQKKSIVNDFELTNYYTINTELSDSSINQIVVIRKNIPIKSTLEFTPVSGAKISLEQLGTNYPFLEFESGVYYSISEFSLVNGEEYTIKYELDTSTLEVQNTMPFPIEIDSLILKTEAFNSKLFVKLMSLKEQPFLYQVFMKATDTLSENTDTSWTEMTSDIPFQIGLAEMGLTEIQLLDEFSFGSLEENVILKVELKAIDQKAKAYFHSLNTYYQTIATSSTYVNPPRYYSNHFYGITYGSSKSVLIDSL